MVIGTLERFITKITSPFFSQMVPLPLKYKCACVLCVYNTIIHRGLTDTCVPSI